MKHKVGIFFFSPLEKIKYKYLVIYLDNLREICVTYGKPSDDSENFK